MVFVYFAFWGLQEEFSTLPCSHPALLHNFGCCYIILMMHKNSSKDVIKINKKCFLYADILRFVQIRNNRYENRLIFLLLASKNIVFP
jgi:hypothetical protein